VLENRVLRRIFGPEARENYIKGRLVEYSLRDAMEWVTGALSLG
jgi:hypothetical protein